MISGLGRHSSKPLTAVTRPLVFILIAVILTQTACGATSQADSTSVPTPTEAQETPIDSAGTPVEDTVTVTPSATATDEQGIAESANADVQPQATDTIAATHVEPQDAEIDVVDEAADETGSQDLSAAEEPTTVHISADGQGDFATLNEAVRAVLPGSIIILEAGDHHLSGRLVFSKTLSIQGQGVDLTTVSCSECGTPIIAFGDGDLVLKDLAVERTGQYAGDILKVTGGSVSLESCSISGGAGSEDDAVKGHGIILRNDAVASIENCSITDNMGVGVGTLESVTITISQATITNNGGGVIIGGESQGEVVDSIFAYNQDQAIVISDRAQVSVISNTVHDNEAGIVFHLTASGGEAIDNKLARNGANLGGADIMVFQDFYPTIRGNTCDGRGISFANADFNGIVFITRSSSPSDAPVLQNSCSVARCSTPTGSMLNIECG